MIFKYRFHRQLGEIDSRVSYARKKISEKSENFSLISLKSFSTEKIRRKENKILFQKNFLKDLGESDQLPDVGVGVGVGVGEAGKCQSN